MPNERTVEQFLLQLRDDDVFRRRFMQDRDLVLSQETGLDESQRKMLRAFDMTAFLSACCASAAIGHPVAPMA